MAPDHSTKPFVHHRLGGWLPRDPKHIKKWLGGLVDHVKANPQVLNPVLQEFKLFIESDSAVKCLFGLMFEQIPFQKEYLDDPTGKPQVRNYLTMLDVFNVLMTTGPFWIYTTSGQQGLVGFPFNAVLDWPMGTAAGISAFLRPDINQQFRNVLNAWGQYLASPASVSVLNASPEGWFSSQALAVMTQVAAAPIPGKIKTFSDAFECDPTKPAYGYKSWDDFFVRKFKPGVRPVDYPNDTRVICNACESGTYRISTNVRPQDTFWIKEQPYSLFDMLNNDVLAPRFVGGTIYQAFLSALSYHRWHSPVDGTIVKVVHIPGSYYAENYWWGFANINPQTGKPDPDPAAPNDSQGYICEVAARALILIQANDPRIGLVGVLAVGMAEVSSCEVFVKSMQPVAKGQEIGTFHFGGSTHCVLFTPTAKLQFIPRPPFSENNLAVCSALAVVVTQDGQDAVKELGL